MASFTEALRDRLLADAAVAALAEARIYWLVVPQGAAKPYIRMQVISDPRPEHLQDYDGARRTIVRADCFAEKTETTGGYAASRALALAVIAALARPAVAGGIRFGRGKAEGPRDLGEDTAGGHVHRASVDIAIEHTGE